MRSRLALLAALPLLSLEGADSSGLYFDGPEVIKLDWNTSCPRAGDFNGDGLQDLVLLNQDRARIEFLLQRKEGLKLGEPERTSRTDRWNPILEISRLEKQPLVIGHSTWSLTVGDWNGDGRPDIAYTTDEDKLVLRTQGKPGDWSQKKEFPLDSTSEDPDVLLAVDLDGDKRDDLALLTSTRLMVWLQKSPDSWSDPKTYVLGQSGCGGLRAADLDGDGKKDLFYTAADADALLVRLQKGGVGFGEEWRLEMPASRCWVHPIKLGDQTGLAWLRQDTNMAEVAKLAQGIAEPDSDRAATIRHAMPSADSKGGATVYGDLNGDKLSDVVLAEPKNARLWFFAGLPGGSFAEGREFPALSGIEGLTLADVDADGQAELIILSPAEKSIGLARWQKDRLTYPEVIHQATDTLLALQAGKIGESSETAVLALTESKSKISLLSLRWSDKDKKFQNSTQELPSSPTRPNALRVIDANQDGKGDLAIFSGIASMQILLSQKDAKAPFKRAEGLPDNLLNKLSPLAMTTADVDGDGKAEIIVAKDQLARALRIGSDGKAVAVEQFNAPEAGAQITKVILKPEKSGKAKVLLVDATNGHLYEMTPGDDGVYRSGHTHALSSLTPEECHLISTQDGEAILMIGKTSFEINPLTGHTLKLETLTTFDSELKDTTATDLLVASFTQGPTDDLILVDSGKSRVLELFRAESASPPEWVSSLYFRVFETDPQYRGKTGLTNEPHDYTAVDLNGDGRLDIALLVHDRLLLYVRK
ncbi:Repeat domain-containing protein [Prosthecobacter debontii]|uniref:Repeat domain-containing protein n=1 Tax=Prosthecobacter debontii TaxID=48467 RepID=A0A1T4XBT9_9BACT|nr:VCBS repeat-containing protein [Prosthecobacter debontii]SKA86421.1 Repeat domain-containing protein [Prosthecobacter debontii]